MGDSDVPLPPFETIPAVHGGPAQSLPTRPVPMPVGWKSIPVPLRRSHLPIPARMSARATRCVRRRSLRSVPIPRPAADGVLLGGRRCGRSPGRVLRLARLRPVEPAKHGPARRSGPRYVVAPADKADAAEGRPSPRCEATRFPPRVRHARRIPMVVRRVAVAAREHAGADGRASAAGGCASRTRPGAFHGAGDHTACRRARVQRSCESAGTLPVTLRGQSRRRFPGSRRSHGPIRRRRGNLGTRYDQASAADRIASGIRGESSLPNRLKSRRPASTPDGVSARSIGRPHCRKGVRSGFPPRRPSLEHRP